ncbi:MAG: DUF3540 domain-containing protein [Myxococcota bacterium]|nr:DUF3540 domain-containing protein [Myxococcota bacterium]
MNALPLELPHAGAFSARVTAARGARVELECARRGQVEARNAAAGYRPRAGDRVLVIEGEGGALFVVGVLTALREAGEPLVAEDGSEASLGADGVLRVRDGSGALLFEHHGDRSVVHAPRGDLALRAEGRVTLDGQEGVEARSDGPIELASGASALRLDDDRASLVSPRLSAETEEATLRSKDASLVVGTLRTAVHRLRERVEHVDRRAGRVVEHAREIFREVEGLEQTKAGRLRLVAEKALYAIGGQTLLKAREDVKIKGEKVYLG